MSSKSSSQGNTGTHDVTYNLISTAYHLLQGAETVSMYMADAQQQGDQELVQFFTEAKAQYTRLADQAKQMLAKHVAQEQGQAASGSKA